MSGFFSKLFGGKPPKSVKTEDKPTRIETVQRPYDKVPEERATDCVWLWEQQISGEMHFDVDTFAYTLYPEMLHVFDPIIDKSGMLEFLSRIRAHFVHSGSQENANGSFAIYQHPSRTPVKNRDIDKIKTLMRRHLLTLHAVLKGGEQDNEETQLDALKTIPIKWLNDAPDFWALDHSLQSDLKNGDPLGFYFYDAWDDYGEIKTGTPSILYELIEATYTLAACYDLQRYLMQSFFDRELDFDALYELEWKHNCIFFFDETTCYVTQAENPNA